MESFSETLNVPFILELILVCIIQSLENYKLCSSSQVTQRIKFYPAIPNCYDPCLSRQFLQQVTEYFSWSRLRLYYFLSLALVIFLRNICGENKFNSTNK